MGLLACDIIKVQHEVITSVRLIQGLTAIGGATGSSSLGQAYQWIAVKVLWSGRLRHQLNAMLLQSCDQASHAVSPIVRRHV